MKIGIVGAQESKWKTEKIPEVKNKIREIIVGSICNEKCCSSFRSGDCDEYNTGQLIQCLIEIIVVSGHCHVGKERYWCFEEEKFIDDPRDYAGKGYQFSPKVYDKGGVDTWTEIICAELGIKTEIHPAPAKSWNDKWVTEGSKDIVEAMSRENTIKLTGFRSRNIDMAKSVGLDENGVMHCISPKWCYNTKKDYCIQCKDWGHIQNGGCWTLKYFKKHFPEKEGHLVEV